MNNTIKLAVASALLAAASSASAAGGIVAGDWTLDVGGVVNAYYTTTKQSGDFVGSAGATLGGDNATTRNKEANITTGLLPNYLAVSGKTRQNDLDVGFTISLNPGASTTRAGIQSANQENRQAFVTFGDASWGSVKLGKDLGVYASDAILNDMTLLGVGSGAGFLAGNTTTLGRIGTGFMYADWKSQVVYSSPNFNGFNFSAGVTQAWNATAAGQFASDENSNNAEYAGPFDSALSTGRGGSQPAFEAKASYAFAADAVTGKVWASGISQKVEDLTFDGDNLGSRTASAWDLGANVNMAGFGLTGYYGEGRGMGTTLQLRDGFDSVGNKRKSEDWYLQATYALPGVATKLGVSYGESQLKATGDDESGLLTDKYQNDMWTVGVYHPITKHLNLVAEYSEVQTTIDDLKGKSKTMSAGAILFF
jgi:predicted porin